MGKDAKEELIENIENLKKTFLKLIPNCDYRKGALMRLEEAEIWALEGIKKRKNK